MGFLTDMMERYLGTFTSISSLMTSTVASDLGPRPTNGRTSFQFPLRAGHFAKTTQQTLVRNFGKMSRDHGCLESGRSGGKEKGGKEEVEETEGRREKQIERRWRAHDSSCHSPGLLKQ